jgi:hypothetical protein
MKNTVTLILAVVACGLLLSPEGAEDTKLRATLGANAYGRNLEIKINDIAIVSITGGASQGAQLFHKDHPNLAQVQEDMKYLFCLNEGLNSIEITYSPREGETRFTLDVYIRAVAYTVPVLAAKRDPDDKEGVIEGTFELYPQQPEGFKTIELE